jgi:D-sedoheptulose 7-phosphate isomerase
MQTGEIMTDNTSLLSAYIRKSIETKQTLLNKNLPEMGKTVDLILDAYRNGHTVFWFGNGGSAADAQHLACELVSRFFIERKALASVALTTNTSELTAIANDYSFDAVFSRQIEALVKKGDVVIGISTSGNSPNVIEGLKKAKEYGAITVAFTGQTGGKMKEVADILIAVPSDVTPHIQECHIMIGHVICYAVEKRLFAENEQ